MVELMHSNPDYEEDEGGVHCEWLNEDDTIITKSLLNHYTNNCISKDKIIRIIDECQEQLGETHSGIRAFATLLKEKLGL